MKKSQVKFNSKALEKAITDRLIPVQTAQLVAYAKDTIQKIGNAIQAYHSRNHMDRTGNLLNSLCWGVSYRGELAEAGYYREASSLRQSYLHEWSKEYSNAFPVEGHAAAANYIQKYGATYTDGWRVFFAILAPYWGYWEEGFTFRSKRRTGFMQFAVMTQFYDTVTKELKPAKVYFRITKDIRYSGNMMSKVNESGRYDKWQSKSKYSHGWTKRRRRKW